MDVVQILTIGPTLATSFSSSFCLKYLCPNDEKPGVDIKIPDALTAARATTSSDYPDERITSPTPEQFVTSTPELETTDDGERPDGEEYDRTTTAARATTSSDYPDERITSPTPEQFVTSTPELETTDDGEKTSPDGEEYDRTTTAARATASSDYPERERITSPTPEQFVTKYDRTTTAARATTSSDYPDERITSPTPEQFVTSTPELETTDDGEKTSPDGEEYDRTPTAARATTSSDYPDERITSPTPEQFVTSTPELETTDDGEKTSPDGEEYDRTTTAARATTSSDYPDERVTSPTPEQFVTSTPELETTDDGEKTSPDGEEYDRTTTAARATTSSDYPDERVTSPTLGQFVTSTPELETTDDGEKTSPDGEEYDRTTTAA
ncbi:hypothetical protein OSTOST_12972, partial [Ostertagia ostertagi]